MQRKRLLKGILETLEFRKAVPGVPGVNADQSDNGAMAAGAVYGFARAAGVWSQQVFLKSSNPEALDRFGIGLAVSGDTIVVGANSEGSSAIGIDGDQADNGANNAGAVYIFR